MSEVHDIDHFERSCLRVVIDVSVLSVHVQKEHFEASETLNSKLCALELLLVAHDLVEDIGSATLI